MSAVSPPVALAAGVSTDVLVVFGVVVGALVLFVTEWLPIDVTAILIMVVLAVLEPWTQVSTAESLSGFSNKATIAVLAMLILSTGVSRTGLVQLVGRKLSAFAGENKSRQLGATIAAGGPVSGFVNNTPVVAILVPVISDLAHKGKTSPSKLLMPLSFASMLGGTLTLIGTSTNLLASETTARLADQQGIAGLHAFSMFEFTHLGVLVLAVGSLYLFVVAPGCSPIASPSRTTTSRSTRSATTSRRSSSGSRRPSSGRRCGRPSTPTGSTPTCWGWCATASGSSSHSGRRSCVRGHAHHPHRP